jgi:hypothetical protein
VFILRGNHQSHLDIKVFYLAKNTQWWCHFHLSKATLRGVSLWTFQTFVHSASETWIRGNHGKLTFYDIPIIVIQSQPNAFTPKNVKWAFLVTGIWPFNSDYLLISLTVHVKIVSRKVQFLKSQPHIHSITLTLQHPAKRQDPRLWQEMSVT